MENNTESSERFTILDWIGVFLTISTTLALFVFPWVVAPSWLTMLADLGENVPAVTILVLRPWFTPSLATVAVGLLVLAGRPSSRITVRRACVVGAFIYVVACIAATAAAMYLPVFQLAGSIDP